MEESVGKAIRIIFTDGEIIEKYCEEYVRKETDDSFKEYESISKEIDDKLVGIITASGIEIKSKSDHFIARVIGSVEQKRNGVELDKILEALKNKDSTWTATKAFANGASQKIRFNDIEVTINPETGNLIQTNPRKRK